MAVKKRGIGSMLIGLAIGAVATYLSNPKNRQKTIKAAKNLADEGKTLAKEYKKNPKKTKEKLKKAAVQTVSNLATQGKAGALKKVAKASKTVKKAKKLLD